MLALVQVAGVSQSSLAIRPPAAPRSPSSSWREMFRSADFRCLFLAEGWSYPPAAWRSRSARTACELCQLGLMVRQMLAVLEPEQTPTAYLGCPAVLYEGKTLCPYANACLFGIVPERQPSLSQIRQQTQGHQTGIQRMCPNGFTEEVPLVRLVQGIRGA